MKKITMFAIALLLLLVTGSFAQTKYVSFAGDNSNDGNTVLTAYKTIQFALDQSPTTIIVSGTVDGSTWANNFLENYTSDIIIQGQDNAKVNYAGRMFRIEGSNNVTLKDIEFTFTGGSAFTDQGGFIFSGTHNGNLTITNCTVKDYYNTTVAAAIRNNGTGTIAISNSSFINNRASDNGGALWVSNGTATITDSRFRNNTSDLDGGAIYTEGNVNLTVTNSSFDGNIASNENADLTETISEGGAIYFSGGGIISLTNATFYKNSAEYQGSAIWDNSGASHTITNCTFIENSTIGTAANSDRASAYRTENGTYTITNSIFFGNTVAKPGQDNGDFSFVGGSTTGTISNTLAGQPAGNTLTSGANVNLSATTLSTTTFTLNETTGKVEFTGPTNISDATPIDFYENGTRKDAGAWESNINIFKGTSATWADATNWTSGVIPSATENIHIPSGLSNNPVIVPASDPTANNLTVVSGASLTVESEGSLIVNGTSSGNVTYNRSLDFISGNTEGWHLIGSPVVGEHFDDAWVAANDIAINGSNRAIATYTTAANTWLYHQGGDGTFASGKGYSAKIVPTPAGPTSADISFEGTINTVDPVTTGVILGDSGFNLIANPYTSYVNSKTFLESNTDNLVLESIWLWDPSNNRYDTYVSSASFILSPGQGFFVRASAATDLNFAESNQSHSGDTFQKSVKTGFELFVSNGESERYAKIYFSANAKDGFDNGYDGETFGGIKNEFDVFTQLVKNNLGKSYQIQTLSDTNFKSLEIPVGITTKENTEIVFSAKDLNLPTDVTLYFEDRQLNTFTEITAAFSYKATFTDALDGVGRFYLTTSNSVLNTDLFNSEKVSVYQSNKNELTLSGLAQGTSSVSLHNVLGKTVFSSVFNTNGVEVLKLPNLVKGIYIIKLESNSNNITKKIILE
jgi:predicted outer membrane repeat protein